MFMLHILDRNGVVSNNVHKCCEVTSIVPNIAVPGSR